jgi:hypothetical protein
MLGCEVTLYKMTSGWLVRATTFDALGRAVSKRDLWVGDSDKTAAEQLVRVAGLAAGEKAVGVKPLFIDELAEFGVVRGQVKLHPDRPH